MKPSTEFDQYRKSPNAQFASTPADGANGIFVVPLSKTLHNVERIAICMVSDGNDEVPWEHVSVRISERRGSSCHNATPTWDEMCAVKDVFWNKDEVCLQLHPAEENYINCHPHVLHLWKPLNAEIPLPPLIAV